MGVLPVAIQLSVREGCGTVEAPPLEVTVEQDRYCDRCHAPAVFGFGTTWLCESCYGVLGSCCMEFDGDDLFLEDRSWWESRIETKSSG